MCKEEKPLKAIWKTWGLNMLKWLFSQSEKAEKCLDIIVCGMFDFQRVYATVSLHEQKRCPSVTKHKSLRLKVAAFIAIERISYVLKSLSSLQRPNKRCLTNSSHYLIFLFICPIYFCTAAVLATHENTWAVEGTVHVPWVIFNKSLTRQFHNSQIHASNGIYSKDTNLSHLWCYKFDSCWIMWKWMSSTSITTFWVVKQQL